VTITGTNFPFLESPRKPRR